MDNIKNNSNEGVYTRVFISDCQICPIDDVFTSLFNAGLKLSVSNGGARKHGIS